MEDDLGADLGWGDEPDERELDAEWERARTEALHRLRRDLAKLRGKAPPAGEIRAAAAELRAKLRSGEYPFPQLARTLEASGGQALEDTELLIRAVAATVAPLPENHEEEVLDGGQVIAQAERGTRARDGGDQDEAGEEDLPLDMDTEDLELEDWLALVVAAVTAGPSAWTDPEELVAAAGLDPDSDEGWIKEGAFARALLLWEDFGMLADGRATRAGRWVLPRALARAWEGDFDQDG